ncbi:MAG: LysM peptidoglycan-binding domain-containing protein [Planctomycetia bacterium]|nr:LysM peptidoglycan-binding domain-containing protein [Planctomycetia bacterium]
MSPLKKSLIVISVVAAGGFSAYAFRKPAEDGTDSAISNAAPLPRRAPGGVQAIGRADSQAPQGVPLPIPLTPAVADSTPPPSRIPVRPPAQKSPPTAPELPSVFSFMPANNSSANKTAATGEWPRAVNPSDTAVRGDIAPQRLSGSQAVAKAVRAEDATEADEDDPAEERPGTGFLAPDPNEWRTHVVVDGDTLSSLAAHYLGDSGRFVDVYEANRTALRNADMLPIGTTLRIPPLNSRSASAQVAAPVIATPASASRPTTPVGWSSDLMPIPPGVLKSQPASDKSTR